MVIAGYDSAQSSSASVPQHEEHSLLSSRRDVPADRRSGRLHPGGLLIAISCDEGVGFEWARPTGFTAVGSTQFPSHCPYVASKAAVEGMTPVLGYVSFIGVAMSGSR